MTASDAHNNNISTLNLAYPSLSFFSFISQFSNYLQRIVNIHWPNRTDIKEPRKKADESHEERSGERNVDSGFQAQPEGDEGVSTMQNWVEATSVGGH